MGWGSFQTKNNNNKFQVIIYVVNYLIICYDNYTWLCVYYVGNDLFFV